MIGKFFLAIFFAGVSVVAYAQQKVTVGTPYDVIDADTKIYFTQGDVILAVKMIKSKVIIQKMDARTLKLVSTTPYTDFEKGYDFQGVRQFKKKIYFFYSLVEGKQVTLYYREVEFATGKFKGAGKEMFKSERKSTGDFHFISSRDSSSLVLYYTILGESQLDNPPRRMAIRVFDNDINLTGAWKTEMPYAVERMEELDLVVDSKNNFYVLARIFADESKRLKKKGEDDPNYHLEVIKVAANTGIVTSTKIEMDGKFVKTVWIYEGASKEEVICAGLYNNNNSKYSSDGILLFKVGENGQLSGLNAIEFPLDLINQNASDKARRKNEKHEKDDELEFLHIALDRVVVQDDGSFLVTGEQKFEIINSTTSGGSTSQYWSFYSQHIIAAKINADGSLAWIRKLPKAQRSLKGFEFIGYRYFLGQGKHHFIFLDNQNNLHLPATEFPAMHIDGQGGFLTACTIDDKTGSVNKEALLNTRDVQGLEIFQLSPRRILSPLPNALVFEAYKKKKEDVLVKIDL